jgi:hypothetical protein
MTPAARPFARPRLKGSIFRNTRTCVMRAMANRAMVNAHAIAAPDIPNRGMSTMFSVTLNATAAR